MYFMSEPSGGMWTAVTLMFNASYRDEYSMRLGKNGGQQSVTSKNASTLTKTEK